MGKDLLQYKGMKPILIGLTLLTIIQGVAILMQAIKLAEVVTHLFEGKAFTQVYGGVGLFAAFFLLRYAAGHAKQRVVYFYAMKTGADLRKSALTNLFHIGPRVAKQWGTGNVVTLLIEGISQFQQYLQLFLPKMTNMLVIPAFVAAYILSLDRTSAVIVIVTVPILIGFMILLGLAAKKKADGQWKAYRLLSNHFVDSLRGLETLKYLGRSRAHKEKIRTVSERYEKATMGTLRIAFLSSFAMDFFTMLSVATVAVFLGLRLINGEITLEPALAILILAPEFFLPIREIGSDYHATLNGQEAGRKLLDLTNVSQMKKIIEKSIATWTETSVLTLKDAAVRHDDESNFSLEQVTFQAKGYQKIGIVGASGAGKSTMIDILGGFTALSSGGVEVDGDGFPHLQTEQWQKQVHYIAQKSYIFHDSLLNNIRFYTPDATEAEVEWAVVQAGLTELVNELPHGLDEKIGEGGRTLSGGQAQRVAMARAFLGKRPVLLLDEPTAHLDVETEYELKKNLLPLFQNKLVVLATHRLHWMQEMDYVYVLEKGKVVDEGTYEELVGRNGLFYEMLKLQEGGKRGEAELDMAVCAGK